MLVSITVLYIGFSAAHPDFWIAKYNIAQAETEGGIDESQLVFNLSLDAAVPVLEYYEERLEEPELYYNAYHEEYRITASMDRIMSYCERIEREEKEMNIRTFNFSKALAVYKWKQYEMPEYNRNMEY